MSVLKNLNTIAWWLIIVGGVNWGLVGLGNFLGAGNLNLVEKILGSFQGASDLVYLLVGLSAVYLLWGRVAK
ncbi:MAG: DUF378 domain-containing protein [Patescibacteria group bacterium]